MNTEKIKISVVLSVYNEEKNIKRCLDSVKWVDEIIVIDNKSTDHTIKIAQQYTNKIFERDNNPMLNINKNFGFSKAEGEWILNIDGDEEITEEVKNEILKKVVSDTINGYWLPRKNIIFNKWIKYGLWWPDKQLRLFKRNFGKFPCNHVHEYILVEGLTAEFEHPFNHYNYSSIDQYLEKMFRYTKNETDNLLKSNYKVVWFDAFRFPVSDFIKIYFAQKAYKDGLHGLILSILQSFYSFIVFTRLWESEKYKDVDIPLPAIQSEIIKNNNELIYWFQTAKLKETTSDVKKLYIRFFRKLHILN